MTEAGEDLMQAAVVTVSDGVARGVRDDRSGHAVAALLEGTGFTVSRREVVPDQFDEIAVLLNRLADVGMPLVVTTGGTGLGPRDVTPEATRAVIDREAPGLAEEMRAVGRGSTPFAALSRGVVGSRGSTLIVNLPGSERGATESLQAILETLPHALNLLAGHTVHGPADAGAVAEAEVGPNPSSTFTDLATGGHDHNRHGEPRQRRSGEGPRSIEDELAAHRAAGERVVMATAVKVEGNPPCRVGQKILLGPSGPLTGTLGCAEFDHSAIDDAGGVLERGRPVTHTYVHELGSVDVYLEPFVPLPRLVVFSATPVSMAMIRWARDLGFEPVLVESRAERITPEHREAAGVFPDLRGIHVDADTVAVHTDHDAPGVAESVAALLRSPARFIGVMGSTRHVGPHVDALRARGFTEQDLARVRTPVGIDLGARTAEEIALSIMAGLVADRHGSDGGWLDRRG